MLEEKNFIRIGTGTSSKIYAHNFYIILFIFRLKIYLICNKIVIRGIV